MIPRSKFFGFFCAMVLASSFAVAQDSEDSGSGARNAQDAPAAAETTPKKKGHKSRKHEAPSEEDSLAKTETKSKQKQKKYATEAEAKARCHGAVVWVDGHNFNHYEGTREYGKKPGAFACENG
jgi:hypothetical protein